MALSIGCLCGWLTILLYYEIVLGAITGAMAFTSLTRWNRIHNKHHAISNNLDENQHAQTAPWSVKQYEEADPKVKPLHVHGW
mgnify:CR=1 FL=1